jgi:hypothetical protein
MFSWIFRLRLRLLSYIIVSCTFQRGEYSKNDYKLARHALYEDMLQYKQEHSSSGYHDLYLYFVGEENVAVARYYRQYLVLVIAFVLITFGILSYTTLSPACNFLLNSAPISCHEVQH